jgi:hypothetical protein
MTPALAGLGGWLPLVTSRVCNTCIGTLESGSESGSDEDAMPFEAGG